MTKAMTISTFGRADGLQYRGRSRNAAASTTPPHGAEADLIDVMKVCPPDPEADLTTQVCVNEPDPLLPGGVGTMAANDALAAAPTVRLRRAAAV